MMKTSVGHELGMNCLQMFYCLRASLVLQNTISLCEGTKDQRVVLTAHEQKDGEEQNLSGLDIQRGAL